MAGVDPVSMASQLVTPIVGLGQTIYGSSQTRKGRKEMEKLLGNQPQYEIPDSVLRMLELYKTQANADEMPGTNIYKENLGAAQAANINAAQQSSDTSVGAMSAVTGAYKSQVEALRDLMISQSQWKERTQQNYANALQQAAPYQEKQ